MQAMSKQLNELRKENEALKLKNGALKSMIEKLNDQLCEKTKLLGDMENFSGLQAPANVSWIS